MYEEVCVSVIHSWRNIGKEYFDITSKDEMIKILDLLHWVSMAK